MSGRIKALSLYKNILRAHDKFLPHEMKQLGDAYVKSEVSPIERELLIMFECMCMYVYMCISIVVEIFLF